jgi:hypothetical protein
MARRPCGELGPLRGQRMKASLSRPPAPINPPTPGRLPTLFVSECCLVYLEPPDARALLAWAAAASAPAPASAVAVYEMVRPDDAFGRTMVANLEVGLEGRGFRAQPTAGGASAVV